MSIKNPIVVIVVLILATLLVWKYYPNTNVAKPPIPKIENLNTPTTTPKLKNPETPTIAPKTEKTNMTVSNLSAWLWDSPDTFTEGQLRKMFSIARGEKIDTIYLRVDDYVDIYEMRDGNQKTLRLQKFNDSVRTFITIAGEYKIKVQALGGNTDWAEPNQRFYPNLLFDAVIKYNESNLMGVQFVGIQFDVESNNSVFYKKDKIMTLTKYLDFVQEMADKKQSNVVTANSSFSMGFDIPFWYDDQNNNGVVLNWRNNGSKPVGYHLFDILNKTTGGYVVIMDYRNFAEGRDGAIENAQDEMDYASQNSPNVKIIIGQETTKVSPPKITFYDTSKDQFKAEASKITRAFAKYKAFTGIAIHHLPSYIDL